jgi:hypothetical protein
MLPTVTVTLVQLAFASKKNQNHHLVLSTRSISDYHSLHFTTPYTHTVRLHTCTTAQQVEETMQLFLQQFMDETVSDGAVEAMSQFQSTWCKCLDTGKQAKVHLTEVFLLKGAKMCVDGKASDNITAITEGKQLLSTKLGVLKSKGLEVSEHLFCPWLVKEARRLLEDTPAAAAGLDTL